MASIYVWDATRCMLLTDTEPSRERFPTTVLSMTPTTQEPVHCRFATTDEALAWHLTATAQRVAAFHGYASEPMELQTWVLGTARERVARLDAFFQYDPPYTNRRVLIHHINRVPEGRVIGEPIWEQVHEYYGIAGRAEHRKELYQVGRSFLLDMFDAHAGEHRSADKLQGLLTDSGHRYTSSRGFDFS